MTASRIAIAEPIRVVVVDDEPLARDDLVRLLARRRDVDVAGICTSGVQAVEAVARLRPDLLLLDIKMPGLDGFGVVSRIDPAWMPHIIFVTAFDGYAIDAIHVRAVDYLLKPVQASRLDEALGRARDQIGTRGVAVESGYWCEVMVRTGLRDVVVRVDDIDWIEADAYYARLHVRGKSYLLRERMHVLERHLDPAHFARVHRSAMVNLSRIAAISHDGQGEHVVVLNTGTRVKTSHARWLEFRELMRRRGRPELG